MGRICLFYDPNLRKKYYLIPYYLVKLNGYRILTSNPTHLNVVKKKKSISTQFSNEDFYVFDGKKVQKNKILYIWKLNHRYKLHFNFIYLKLYLKNFIT